MRFSVLPILFLLASLGLQAQSPCEVFDLTVTTGDCNPNAPTYVATINFQVQNATNDSFAVFGNNQLLGRYPLTALPFTINSFPYNGGANDVVEVCIVGNEDCCRIKEFAVPACMLNNVPCEVYNLVVDTGDCTSDSTYNLLVNFQVANSSATHFDVYGNGVFIGNYALSALPLTIPNFQYNGGANDVIKVCVNQNTTCCKTLEFPVPACLSTSGPCEISNLVVDTGDCTSDSTYNLLVNFQVANSSATHFDVYGNGVFIGNYALSALPLTIQNFQYNGGANDVIKVCVNQNTICCKTLEFPVPACLSNSGPCEIYNLVVETGECHADSTYTVVVNFQVDNPTNNLFDVWGNGVYIGNYPLSALPLTIEHFPYNGGANDVIKVCINDNTNCCRIKEFPVPACITGNGTCDIVELSVTTGDCHADSTYTVVVNFQVVNPTNNLFDVWGNGVYIGNYPLSALPLTIEHFPYNGGANDVIKVCINDNTNCCQIKEFPVPGCITGNGGCDIVELSVETGDCHGDSTYTVVVNFQVVNATNNLFDVWGNGVYIGNYPLSALPLTIEHFPYNGGANDVIKICVNDNPNCCQIKEFPVPGCLQEGDCHIWDLNVKTSDCLCGQFFAVLTFNWENTGSGGFDIVGNGINYGNFDYAHSQPVILGPLEGNGSTAYEFVVKDHLHPDCQDVFELGVIDCPETPTFEARFVAGTLTVAPNPVTDWLTVTAQLEGGQTLGSGEVTIRSTDGRSVKSISVGNAAVFNIHVGELPAGSYHITLETAAGKLQNTFVKK